MMESAVFMAFAMGLISACSLPLGTLTAGVWTPSDRIVARLMAFGGGALLAALTIDLVGNALARGHFYPLAIGCVVGGLLFVGLNQLVNSRGGFLRKASTTIYHLRKKKQQRFKRVLGQLGRLDVFRQLPSREVEALARVVISREYLKGTVIYRRNDPPDELYIIEKGAVELLDPRRGMQTFKRLEVNDCFGRMAFFAGAPHATVAVITADSRLWVLRKDDFNRLLHDSPALVAALPPFVESDKMVAYLRERHGMKAEQVNAWVENAVGCLQTQGMLPEAIGVERRNDEFTHVANQISRLPIFQDLPGSEVEAIAAHIFCKNYQRGDTFFYQHQPAERLYIIEHGEVALIDPLNKSQNAVTVGDHQAFGGLSFLTGTRHSVSAVATTDTTVWVLRRRDFDEILKSTPQLEQRVKAFLQQQETTHYLQQKQNFDHEQAARWTRRVLKSIDTDKLIPSAQEMAEEVKTHEGAAMAIWLGIMLDGIPESLVIGASLVHANVSLSLLAGLFLANYPEALSSSVGMRHQGLSFGRVLLMWTSLMIITGFGAALGNVFFQEMPPFVFSLVEGIAAGAMLTMIAETMLPEAYFKGGSMIGLATLCGFLTAIFFKTWE